MNYQALFDIAEKQNNLKMSSAANCRWRFVNYPNMVKLSTYNFDLPPSHHLIATWLHQAGEVMLVSSVSFDFVD